MHFTIITPSFNQCAHLKRCVASVREQISEGTLKRPGRLVENVEGSLNENPINKGVALALNRRSASCKPLKTGNPDSASSDLNVLNERRDSTISTHDDLNDFNEIGTISVHHHIQDGGSTDGTVE